MAEATPNPGEGPSSTPSGASAAFRRQIPGRKRVLAKHVSPQEPDLETGRRQDWSRQASQEECGEFGGRPPLAAI
jgi:hypothetical protein